MAKPDRPGKGESRLCLPRDYTVVDTETTGLSTESCSLIEVSALRVRGGEVAEEFSTLIRPPWREVKRNGEWQEGYVDDFIQNLTGITDGMLEDAPLPQEALPLVESFLGDDLLLVGGQAAAQRLPGPPPHWPQAAAPAVSSPAGGCGGRVGRALRGRSPGLNGLLDHLRLL